MILGCIIEVCDFWDSYESFVELDVVIIGVSFDSQEKYGKFKEKYNFLFLFFVDDEYKLVEVFDVWKLKKNFGKEYMGIECFIFLIDKEGWFVKEWRKVKVKDYVVEVF